jgi:RNA polymerase sigma-70 factor (ECF subfamily)
MADINREAIIRASEGDIDSFEEIYRSNSGFVYNIALRVSGNAKDAEEITQDVFIKVYKNLKRFAFRSSFRTWVYRITMNTAINFKKRESREEEKRLHYGCVLDDASNDKEKSRDNADMASVLLDRLGRRHKDCVILREIEGLSYEEISKALNININTVRSRLKRARQKLMKLRKGVMGNEM